MREETNSVIGLLHRPYPPGKTEQDMLDHFNEAVSQSTVCVGSGRSFIDKRSFPRVLEAMEAYELGKPEEPQDPPEGSDSPA